MQNASLKITEIFSSLQGEGQNQGRPAVFVRLTGCNLRCTWCDSAYALEGGEEWKIDDLVEKVRGFRRPYVCITGGEPLLQAESLAVLLGRLCMLGMTPEIETNGTIDFRQVQRFAAICMDVKCPSSGESSDLSLLSFIREKDSVKFVVSGEDDCAFAEEVIATHQIKGEIFISPVEGSDYAAIADYVIEHSLPVRFQLQLHKILGVR